MTRILSIGLAFFALFSISAQDLYKPRDVTSAFKKETRSKNGMPGEKYWQNYGRYNITITALPPSRTITGEETITYLNNSPDSLSYLIIKLFLNIHKPGAPRNTAATLDYLTSGMHIDAVSINGENIEWKNEAWVFTNKFLRLPKSLAPKDSLNISMKWHYEISLESNREGMIDSTSYFLAYFYPRIAVYDDVSGWDNMEFKDSHDFYSDFNDYSVTINVPKNYVVWGTGTLQQPEKLLQPTVLTRYNNSFTSDEIIHVVTAEDLAVEKVTTQNEINSWQFKATNIPDMAFGLSNHYVWDASSVVVDDKTERRASVQAAYLESSSDFKKMTGYSVQALDWLSHNWPGIPYPYEKTTVFQGFGMMEYPMMANDPSFEDTTFSQFVAGHEIAHSYMPFYLGINEIRYGFMDEGWATTFELLINTANFGAEYAEELYKKFRVSEWINFPSSEADLPIITPGDALSGVALSNNQYGKASLGYLAMKDLLGDELFKKCLHEYMARWNGKHPIPWDFFYSFNDVSERDLNWFWNNWFFTTNYIDLSIERVEQSKSSAQLIISNIGGMAAPVTVEVTFSDGTSESFHQTPAIWQQNQKQAMVEIKTKKKITAVNLNGGIWMDADETNNQWNLLK